MVSGFECCPIWGNAHQSLAEIAPFLVGSYQHRYWYERGTGESCSYFCIFSHKNICVEVSLNMYFNLSDSKTSLPGYDVSYSHNTARQ